MYPSVLAATANRRTFCIQATLSESLKHTQWNFVLTAFRNVIGNLLPLEDLLGATLACGQCREGHQAKQNLAQHPELMQDHSCKLTLIAVDSHCWLNYTCWLDQVPTPTARSLARWFSIIARRAGFSEHKRIRSNSGSDALLQPENFQPLYGQYLREQWTVLWYTTLKSIIPRQININRRF